MTRLKATAISRLLVTGAFALAALAAPLSNTTVAPPGPAVVTVNQNQDTSGAPTGAIIEKQVAIKKWTVGTIFTPNITSRLLNVAYIATPGTYGSEARVLKTTGSTAGTNTGIATLLNGTSHSNNNQIIDRKVVDVGTASIAAPVVSPGATAAPPVNLATHAAATATAAAGALTKGDLGLTALA